jgi:hypothetical protein
MLISESDDPVSRCICGMVFCLPEHVTKKVCHPEPAKRVRDLLFVFTASAARPSFFVGRGFSHDMNRAKAVRL